MYAIRSYYELTDRCLYEWHLSDCCSHLNSFSRGTSPHSLFFYCRLYFWVYAAFCSSDRLLKNFFQPGQKLMCHLQILPSRDFGFLSYIFLILQFSHIFMAISPCGKMDPQMISWKTIRSVSVFCCAVITSYSIHYTKLYESARRLY